MNKWVARLTAGIVLLSCYYCFGADMPACVADTRSPEVFVLPPREKNVLVNPTLTVVVQSIEKVERLEVFANGIGHRVYFPGAGSKQSEPTERKQRRYVFTVETTLDGRSRTQLPVSYGENKIDVMAYSASGSCGRDLTTVIIPDRPTYAIVVGISQYDNELWPNLRYSRIDADRFANYLFHDLNVPGDHITRLSDKDATTSNILRVIEVVTNSNNADYNLIFYFSGRGFFDDGSRSNKVSGKPLTADYLVPTDGSPKYPLSTMIDLRRLIFMLQSSSASEITVVLDGVNIAKERLDNNPLLMPHLSILSCGATDQTCFEDDELRSGVFTHFLLKKLTEPTGEKRHGFGSIDTIFSFVSDETSQYVAARFKNALQTPQLVHRTEVSYDEWMARCANAGNKNCDSLYQTGVWNDPNPR
jgi:caspase domain-containing protein